MFVVACLLVVSLAALVLAALLKLVAPVRDQLSSAVERLSCRLR